MLHAITICALAKGPTIGPLSTRRKGDWLLYFGVFFCNPNRSSSSYSNLVDFTHRHEITGPHGSDRHKELAFIEATAGPSKAQTTCPPGMLMRCTCTVPWTTSSTSKTFCDQTKRSTSKEFARFEFHIMHLATTRNVQKDWLSTGNSPIAPFPKQHLHHRPYLCQEPGERLQGGHVSVVCLKLNISS